MLYKLSSNEEFDTQRGVRDSNLIVELLSNKRIKIKYEFSKDSRLQNLCKEAFSG
ncbi:hypothetical protein THIOSC15_110003 [uncultured Thiomicrorhabdus sp.]